MTDKDYNPSSCTPPIPPTSEDESFARLRLLRSRRVGIATYNRLLAEHGSARRALAELPSIARAAGVLNYETCPEAVVYAEMRAAKTVGARLVIQGSSDYPQTLNDLSDAPPMLWIIGDATLLNRPTVSLVGARNASSLGTRMAKALARGLGEAGYIVVSGLARGVDAAAHLAALPTGTIAVQAGGVDIMYPVENTRLAEDIAKQGLRISEQPVGLQPMARHFPSRNRIIAGLGQATVIVEAAARSGSLITARDALDQGREVLAVPGHPFDARAAGCNMLIRDGATLVRHVADVIEVLEPLHPERGHDARQRRSDSPPRPEHDLHETDALHSHILSRLGPSPVAEDQLIRDLELAPASVTAVLVELGLNGHVLRQSGGLISRVN